MNSTGSQQVTEHSTITVQLHPRISFLVPNLQLCVLHADNVLQLLQFPFILLH